MSAYGKFHNFCRDSGNGHATLPICNLFDESPARGGQAPYYGGCELNGIALSGGRRLANLGSILVAGLTVFILLFLLIRSELKRAAVGRREMQLFLFSFVVVEICEIFTVGGIPLPGKVTRIFSCIQIAAIVAASWILMLNGAVGYQAIDDGSVLSLGLTLISAAVIFIGTGYIALDTTFSWTGYWDPSLVAPNRSYALYTLYLLVPIVLLVIFFLLESVVVLKVLGEVKPMLYLSSAALLFIIGQIFQFVISVHICEGTGGAINGGFFETLFTAASAIMIWVFWSSITEDDWPVAPPAPQSETTHLGASSYTS